jgi:hypothetical protein
MPATAWGDKGTIRIWQPPAGVQKQIEHNVSPVDGGAWTKYVYAVGIARARHHGLTVALAATHDEGASRWFATFRRGEPGIIESASHYLSDASAADGLTDAEYDEHWDLPDPRGGWIDVGYEYTGNSGLWTTRVSSAGKTVRTSGRDYNFLGDTEVATVSLVPGTRQIVGCGLLRAEVRKKVDTRAFAFKLRLK